ncbi:hypothetical protein GAB11_06630, partial [Bacteroides thetaiotaomicron]
MPHGPPSFLRRARARMPFTVCSFRMPMASMLRRSRDSENPPEAMLSFGASSCWFLSYWVPLCLGSSCW